LIALLIASPLVHAEDEVDPRVADLEARVRTLESTALQAEVENYLAHTDGAQVGQEGGVTIPGARALRISGQVRVRGEVRHHIYEPSDPDAENSFQVTRLRTRLRFDIDLPADLAATVELQDVRLLGEEGSTTADTEGLDIKRAFLTIKQLFDRPLQLDLGRFVLAYGDQRLVGNLEWVDQGRTYDGLRMLYRPDKWWLDLFAVNVRETLVAEQDQYFVGIYGGCGALEAYVLGLLDNRATAGETGTGKSRFATIGARYHAEREGWDYTAELAAQVGELAGDDLLALAAALVVGRTFESAAWKPRIGFEVAYASGDDDGADGDAGTFQTLFPTNHLHYGYADLVAWSNVLDLHVRLSGTPVGKTTVALDYHHFRLIEEVDGWYNAAGVLVRAGAAGASPHLGDEIDLTVTWSPRPALKLLLGYSIFLPGGFVEDTGDDPVAHFLYLQALLQF